ncbi:MAG: ribonuclease [Lachnospiraceae bacterium]|nr:ribonuclease [Lachnospiraceae bacterium]
MLSGCAKVQEALLTPDTLAQAETHTDSISEAEAYSQTVPDQSLESEERTPGSDPSSETEAPGIDEDGVFDSKEDVALYLHIYGHLPHNYITKSEARKLGWSGGSVERYVEDGVIGGDRFGNYEKKLPEGRSYRECDIDTLGSSSRGAKRIIYSDDGYIYYTGDHYETFELLYEGR